MADTELEALSAILSSALAGGDLLYLVDVSAGTAHKLDLDNLVAYVEARGRQNNASLANQTPAAATDVYLTGSDVAIPQGRIQAKSLYRCRIHATKTAAGTATPIFNVRIGTAGTTADTSRGTLTFDAQTAVADEALIEFFGTFRAGGATAVLHTVGILDHRLATTGFSTVNESIKNATSASFDVTGAGLKIGVSVNTGASAAWTITSCQAELFNLA